MGITVGMNQAKELLNQGISQAEELIQNPSQVDELLVSLEEKLKEVPAIGGTLSDIPLMIAMVKAWIKKDYTVVSPKVIACLVGSFIYFVKKKDLIPDSLPVIGAADDVAVLGLALKMSEPELQAFAQWRDGRKVSDDGTDAGDTQTVTQKEDKCLEIKAVKFRKDGYYSQPFAFGGEEGMDKFDPQIRYRGSLQNYLIDTGDEVILVDTGLPAGTPEEKPDENTPLFTGKDICSYMEALEALGYKAEQVSKILLTHKHSDHSGELRSFPNAQIYVNEEEVGAAELQGIPNLVPVKFTDGAYYNFPESQKVADGIFFIKAKGHTNGNSIIIVENDGLFYMLHGDITYVDEALYENKLSIVYDDLQAARETMDRIREFIRNHPTVYCGTHTPQGYENLEAKRVMDLDNPVETVFADIDFSAQEASGKYVCSVCGYVYDPAEHDGTAFEELPDDWKCPRCRQPKEKFNRA
ncbi:MAG: MBL fold metallo-hydrolase [Lachnospiraceae bacterium]|nr:MBL fold metallo-hydrolase [Lachnospiraceae bacterium]